MPADGSIFAGGIFGGGVAFKGASPFSGFDVEPATIRAGAGPLNAAAAASRAQGASVADHASSAAAGVEGAGRLGGLVGQFGAQVSTDCERFAGVLAAGASTLEASAQGYTHSDAPLGGAP